MILFPDPEPLIIIVLYGWSGICVQFRLCFFMFSFCKIIKVNHFLHCFIILLYLVSSLLLSRSLLIPYAYVPMESVDWILMLSFELKAILFGKNFLPFTFKVITNLFSNEKREPCFYIKMLMTLPRQEKLLLFR